MSIKKELARRKEERHKLEAEQFNQFLSSDLYSKFKETLVSPDLTEILREIWEIEAWETDYERILKKVVGKPEFEVIRSEFKHTSQKIDSGYVFQAEAVLDLPLGLGLRSEGFSYSMNKFVLEGIKIRIIASQEENHIIIRVHTGSVFTENGLRPDLVDFISIEEFKEFIISSYEETGILGIYRHEMLDDRVKVNEYFGDSAITSFLKKLFS